MEKQLKSINKLLSADDKRKLAINLILGDDYFKKIHEKINDTYYEYILTGDDIEKKKKTVDKAKLTKLLQNALNNYERAVDRCALEQSLYDDIVYFVYDNKETIENYLTSKNVSKYIDNELFEIIIDYYEDTYDTIVSYGGDTNDNEYEDQTLNEPIKKLMMNPNLNEDVKTSECYKKYYDKIVNNKDN